MDRVDRWGKCLRFTHDRRTAFDDNAAERDLESRTSGGLRPLAEAVRYATLLAVGRFTTPKEA